LRASPKGGKWLVPYLPAVAVGTREDAPAPKLAKAFNLGEQVLDPIRQEDPASAHAPPAMERHSNATISTADLDDSGVPHFNLVVRPQFLTSDSAQLGWIEAVAAAKSISDASARADALSGVVGHLSGEQRTEVLSETLAAARLIGEKDTRAIALIQLAVHLSGAQRTEALSDASDAVQFDFDSAWAHVLIGFACHLSRELLDEALAAIWAFDEDSVRADALTRLAGHLSGEQLAEALAAAKAIDDEWARAAAVSGLAGHLCDEQLAEALALARAISNASARAHALTGLASHLSGEQHREALREALGAAQAIIEEEAKARALSSLAYQLGPPQQIEARKDVLAIGDRLTRPLLLNVTKSFVPAICAVGGKSALVKFRKAIHDAAVWYP
jgi:hypothetical protein